MSATYNWAYKPSVINKYGFTVPAGADTARPAGWCYVALFGNDTTGNGSRNYPFRTIAKAISVVGITSGTNIVLGSGVYRESAIISGSSMTLGIIGDGDVTIDISYNGAFVSAVTLTGFRVYNIKWKGAGNTYISNNGAAQTNGGPNTFLDCIFTGAHTAILGGCYTMTNCIFNGFTGQFEISGNSDSATVVTNCTFYNINNLQIITNTNSLSLPVTSCIFYNCNISTNTIAETKTSMGVTRYSLFFQCNFKMTTGAGSGGALYPSVPTGYTYYSTISALQAAFLTAALFNGFVGCNIADPLFNNLSIGDFSLSFSSPAKNLSFFGTYVGAQSIAYQIKASATEGTGAFDFSTIVNLTIANDSITLVDPTINAEIKTKMIINTNGRQIQKFPLYGFNADRNGQYVDSIPDLDTVYKNPGDTLATPTPYLVEGFALTYNGNVYQIGDRLTTVSGVTTFTSSGAGTLREILEAPERHTIMARFSDGGAAVSAGDALIVGYWYYVISGSVTYDSVVYTAGQGFKAVDTNAFSGTGSVQIALSTESFQHYEPGVQPTSNNTGDTRTGSIIRGNGDPAYVRGGYGVQEFPINAKFIQLYYLINVANLKP